MQNGLCRNHRSRLGVIDVVMMRGVLAGSGPAMNVAGSSVPVAVFEAGNGDKAGRIQQQAGGNR